MICFSCANSPSYVGISNDHPTGSALISADGLLAAYDMETVSDDGRLRDFGPSGLDGVLGTSTPVAGRWGTAQAFDTPADRIKLPDRAVFDQPGPVTVAVWVRVADTGHHQHLVACDDSWALWITPTDQYRLGDTRGTGFNSAPGSVRRGEWQSVVAVWAGTRGDSLTDRNAVIYVDGERSSGSRGAIWSSGPLYPDDACYLGFESHQGNPAHQQLPFHGDLDDVLIFGRAWSEGEVAAHAARLDR